MTILTLHTSSRNTMLWEKSATAEQSYRHATKIKAEVVNHHGKNCEN